MSGAVALTLGFFAAAPLALLVWLAFSQPSSRFSFALRVALVGSWFFFFQRAGAGWAIVSAHLPTALWALLAVATLYRSIRAGTLPAWPPKKPLPWTSAAFLAAMSGLFLYVAVPLGDARQPEAEAKAFTFPLSEGSFYVFHGGDSPVLNHHYAVRAQRYALDILAVDELGRRADGLFPAELEAYRVFGADVVAPCTGVVTGARGDLQDLVPPERDPENLLGNHLLVSCDDVTVVLAHLKEGSLLAKEGQRVKAGRKVAEVGNTGNSSEPHLHVHAVRGDVRDLERVASDDEEGVPMRFGGRSFVRNDLVVVRGPK